MGEADQLEELIKEIAVKHGIAVGRDDPILILQTINNRLLLDSQRAQEALLEQYKEELEGIATRWGNDAKAKAERILNAAMAASKEAMAKTLQDGAVAAAALVRKEVDDALAGARRQVQAARGLSMWNLAAAAITLLAAGVAAWAALGH
ncbi:TPA: conjugal transfer protein TraM [Salmonella enterica subsp. enterica serovar Typhimurium str. D23580]|uniref:conjugal transfer protein TraM n=1 Tax=Burkholderia vietnamiensis TaxID=60552 RepID=UPI001BA20300|nr:conjugal transfer protein TraM [Burkholderia vietnamiensis]MBR8087031.1 conjugal transfer protein TraM [Burkholderia vietnamiensis]HCM7206562.1 conjugal transfer protein TraM [Salmonella enterica subsp. enterica serovar Typhimurium str. D23580]